MASQRFAARSGVMEPALSGAEGRGETRPSCIPRALRASRLEVRGPGHRCPAQQGIPLRTLAPRISYDYDPTGKSPPGGYVKVSRQIARRILERKLVRNLAGIARE